MTFGAMNGIGSPKIRSFYETVDAMLQDDQKAKAMIKQGISPTDGGGAGPEVFFQNAFGGDRLSWLRHLNPDGLGSNIKLLLVFPESGRRWHHRKSRSW